MEFKFDSLDELDAWFNYCCTRCAMCNRDNGKNDPCSRCRKNWTYKAWEEFFGRKEDED